MQTIPEHRFQRWLGRLVVDAETGCWLWQGATWKGYGIANVAKRPTNLHRIFYSHYVGPILRGMHVHHLCEVPNCLYPWHLIQVTRSDHSRLHRTQFLGALLKAARASADKKLAATHCKHDHELTPENVYMDGTRRRCRACGRERSRRYILTREEKNRV